MQGLLPSQHDNAGEEDTRRVCPDFGDVQDNETALHIALYEVELGHRRWGYEVLMRLRDHMLTTREVKSLQWLLPQVEVALQYLDSDSSTAS